MSSHSNPFGKPGDLHSVEIKVDMESVHGRHGQGIFYRAQLSFDPAIFEPGSGSPLRAEAFEIKTLGFDQEDQEQLEAMGVSVARWEKAAIEALSGFGALDAWLEESATDAQAEWLEEAGYLDDLVDIEKDCELRFEAGNIKPVHS